MGGPVSYSALFIADLGVAVLVAAAAGAALHGALTGHRVTGHHLPLLLGLTVGLLAGRAALGTQLAGYGWEFAARRVAYQLPLVAVPTLVALGIALRARPLTGTDRPRSGTVVVACGISAATAAVAVLDCLLLPAPPLMAGLTLAAVLGPPVAWMAVSGTGVSPSWRTGLRIVAVALPALALIVVVATAWWSSRLPGRYDLADYAMVDSGGASSGGGAAHHHGGATSVSQLTGPRAAGESDVRYMLTATPKEVTTASGRSIHGVAFNGTIPGPTLEAHEGDVIEVALVNRGVAEGVTIHWHGVNVPNAEDGVAGVTQDAVADGDSYTYRFRVSQVGTFWYHSHQSSSVEVDRGLYGALVVLPQTAPTGTPDRDLAVLDHGWRPPDGFAPGGEWDAAAKLERHRIAAGTPVRLRLINTDSAPHRYQVVGASFRLIAIDGTDVVGPTEVADRSLLLAAGGRYDIAFAMPAAAVTVTGLGDQVTLVLGDGEASPIPDSEPELDLLGYGSPASTSIDPVGPYDRDFQLEIDRRLGFQHGRVGYYWSVNGQIFPRMPMLMVSEGDLVRVKFVNRTTAHHPMHLHGHHVLVLSRNGEAATGSPWWTDTLNVAPGESYVVAFLADNPEIWLDHCHDLQHAADGFVMHLAYEGVSTPYAVGENTHNRPE
ncbi:MAG TPA: multicopper oxidase family protein [Actinomycetes bacterium]